MSVYCMNCGEKLLEKRASCPECGSEDLFDMDEFRTFAEKKRAYSGMTGKLADVAGAAGWKTSIETGFAFAFLMANAFLVLGGWISRRMTERELDSFP